MNSFDSFNLSGANTTRYVMILANARGIIGAYRKVIETIETGQTPLFLLDGQLTPHLLNRAVEQLHLMSYVIIYRPFEVKLKKRMLELYTQLLGWGHIKKDGSIAEWLQEDRLRLDTSDNDEAREYLSQTLQHYLNYEKAKAEYCAAINILPIDAVTGSVITGDLNEYLYERAKAIFPLGVESILERNIKQSAIPKPRFFVDGLENAPAPKGVRCRQDQLTSCGCDEADICDTVTELREFMMRGIEQNGVVTLPELLTHCGEIGLYKGNITLYAIGSALRHFTEENTVFYDGVTYWRYTETRDISSWILRVYDAIQLRRIKGKLQILRRNEADSALFIDDTTLKERLINVFDIAPTQDKRFDTLGMAIVMIGAWIVHNLRYPIAFLDGTLHRIFRERTLYGEKLKEYDAYFTAERCKWLKARIPHADTIARRAIIDTVGFDPDATVHGMSGLPQGHYAPVLFSVEDYIEEMLRMPKIERVESRG